MDQIEDDELAEMIEEHWRKIAPKKLVAEYDAATSSKPGSKKAQTVKPKRTIVKKATKIPAKSAGHQKIKIRK
jgi:hypothetical protein